MAGLKRGALAGACCVVGLGGIVLNELLPTRVGEGAVPGALAVVIGGGMLAVTLFAATGAALGALIEFLRRAPP